MEFQKNFRSSTLNGPLIPVKQGSKIRIVKGKKNVKVIDHNERGSNQGSSPCRRKNSSPPANRLGSTINKEVMIPDALSLKGNYGFDDLVLDQTQIMIGGHDVKEVAKLAKKRLESN